jgi:hypothetical protein
MCGIFGYASSTGKGPDVDTLVKIALATEKRGEHAHGWAWSDPKGGLGHYKAPGKISAPDAIERLVDMTRNAVAIIGHCRLATHGTPAENQNNHPHPLRDGFYVHNGIIHNYEQLLQSYGLKPASACDSEVLGLLFRHGSYRTGRRAERWRRVVGRAEHYGRLVTLCLWKEHLLAARAGNGNPLHTGKDARGKYMASLQGGLPGEVMYIKPYYMLTFERKGERYTEGKSIRLPEVVSRGKARGYWSKPTGAGAKFNPVRWQDPKYPNTGTRSTGELWDLIQSDPGNPTEWDTAGDYED